MPVMTKTWQFDTNRLNSDAATSQNAGTAYLLFYIKQFLTGALGGATTGLWSVYYSCDGTTAGTPGDGVDRWASQANVVFGSALNSARSWCVLRSPVLPNGMRVFLLLQAQNWTGASSTAGCSTIFYFKNTPTGGTTTAEPTITDPCIYRSSGVNTSPTIQWQSATAGQRRIHAGLTTDGATFYFLMGTVGAGYCETSIVFSLLNQAKSADQYPFYWYGYSSATSPGSLSGGAYFSSGQGYLSGVGNVTANVTRTFNGSTLVQQLMPWPTIQNTSSPYFYPITGTNVVSGADPIDTTYFDFPCYIGIGNVAAGTGTQAAGGNQIRGVLPDFAIAPDAVVQGTVDGPSGSITSVKLGSLWVPINIVPLL